jgi:hypothetical protein
MRGNWGPTVVCWVAAVTPGWPRYSPVPTAQSKIRLWRIPTSQVLFRPASLRAKRTSELLRSSTPSKIRLGRTKIGLWRTPHLHPRTPSSQLLSGSGPIRGPSLQAHACWRLRKRCSLLKTQKSDAVHMTVGSAPRSKETRGFQRDGPTDRLPAATVVRPRGEAST